MTDVIVAAKFDDKTVNISAHVSVDGQDKAATADKAAADKSTHI